MTPRPGQTYHAPDVRIMRLPDQLKAGPDKPPETFELRELRPDLLTVRVTRYNTGPCNYEIVLNNWYDTLPADRTAGFGTRERIQKSSGNPFWPRFKYNDFAILDFGMRLRIDMRYFPEDDGSLSEVDKSAAAWVPMISGPIADMEWTFDNTAGAMLTLRGEDDLSMLRKKNPTKQDYWARPEKEIVQDVLKRAGFPLPIADPVIAWPKFTESTAKALAEAHFEGQTYLEYLMHFAERWDFEMFLEYLSLDNASSGLTFHFEPARCRRPPDNTLHEVYVLERGKNLVEFNPKMKVIDQVTSVTIEAHDHTWQNAAKIDETIPNPPPTAKTPAPSDPLFSELHRDTKRGDPPLVPGPEWRRQRFGLNPHTEMNQRGLDRERAKVMADALYRKKAREFLHIDCKTVGLPRLRAGRHVEIVGMRPPFDGFYYVQSSNHVFGKDGLQTHFDGRRPGAPRPPYGEK
jgi:hypothetical protein